MFFYMNYSAMRLLAPLGAGRPSLRPGALLRRFGWLGYRIVLVQASACRRTEPPLGHDR